MKRFLCVLPAVALLAAAAQVSAADQATYSIKETVVGTMIPQAIITSPVPLDKTWRELSAEQKAVVAQDYESLAPGDEPPFPARGLATMTSNLVRYATMVNPSGSLVAAVDVSPDGRARTITVYRSPDPELTHLVTTMLMNEAYKPASCKGSPCAMQYVLRLDFPSRHGQNVRTSQKLETANGIRLGGM